MSSVLGAWAELNTGLLCKEDFSEKLSEMWCSPTELNKYLL